MLRRLRPFFLLPILLACSKSDTNPIVDFGEGEGITYRTASNLPAGHQDPTDWTSDGDWNKQERALFSDVGFDLNGPQQPSAFAYASAYPNPSIGIANWTVQMRPSTGLAPYTYRAVLVNRNYRVLQSFDAPNIGNGFVYNIDYARVGLERNELYRFYYLVYNANGLVLKGHGDVRYQ